MSQFQIVVDLIDLVLLLLLGGKVLRPVESQSSVPQHEIVAADFCGGNKRVRTGHGPISGQVRSLLVVKMANEGYEAEEKRPVQSGPGKRVLLRAVVIRAGDDMVEAFL